MPRADSPFEVSERINDNAYKVDFPGEYGVSVAFNVADLSSYLEDDYLEDLRANSLLQGENDGGSFLSIIISSTKTKGELKEVIFEALEVGQDRVPLTVSGTVVQWPVRHPRCARNKLPGFVLKIS